MEDRGMLCVVLGAMALAMTPVASQRIQTVELDNSRYHISNASPYSPQLNWFLSYQYCRTLGMQLLAISTQEEADTLTGFLIENNYMASDYWTSGNQLGDQMWIWMSTGQPFNSTWNAWSPSGPPQGLSSKSCVSQIKGIWSAQNCMDNKHFICEQNRCFYYNYVTTNRGGQGAAQPTQGNSSTNSDFRSTSNSSNHQLSRVRVSQRTQPLSGQPVIKQSFEKQPLRNDPHRNQPIRSQLFRNQSLSSKQYMSQIMKATTAQTIQFPTTLLLATTPSTTSSVMPFKFMSIISNDNEETTKSTTSSVMPFKFMSTISNDNEEKIIIPTILNEEPTLNITEVSTEATSVIPTLSALKEALILGEQEPQLNEIQTDVQKERPIALPRILLPPTKSFSAGIQKQKEDPVKDTSSTRSYSGEIQKQKEDPLKDTSTSTRSLSEEISNQKEVPKVDTPDPARMMLLSRKEPVSWA